MVRPPAKELTERELEVMHVFWEAGELTATEIRDSLAGQGRDLAYTTVATLIRILFEKGFLIQMNEQRPFRFKPARPFDDVSKSMIGDMVDRLVGGCDRRRRSRRGCPRGRGGGRPRRDAG